MQQAWNRYAFIRLLLFMALGIVVGSFHPDLFGAIALLFSISTLLYLCSQFLRGHLFPTFQSVSFALLAFSICFSFGYLNTYWQSEKHNPQHLTKINSDGIEAYEAILISEAKETEKTYGFKSAISRILINGDWREHNGKAMIYFEKDSNSTQLKYGDNVLMRSSLSELRPPKNPSEFDYKRFLALDQVYHQQYVRSHRWIKMEEGKGNLILASSIKTSHYLERIMNSYIQDSRSLAIAKALTIGIKDELDHELKNAYASAGAMHVLAVSGLHVGIIFLIISTILKKWRNHKKGRFFFATVSILLLWAYAFITGLSPSVQRAAMMFSFIILAQAMKRRTNIYNTLAASAFVLLSINPFLLFSVGFQLSYLAVLGIVFFQPRIYSLLQFKFILWDKLWAITCVSIAAQVATAPLSLLYFNQFPTYFFLSNIFVIPAAFFILGSNLFLFAISFWAGLANWIGYIIDHFIQLVNYLLFNLNHLPKSTIDGVYISIAESWLLYLAIFFTALFISEKKLNYFKLTVLSLFIVAGSIGWRHYQNFQEQRLTVFDTGKLHSMSIKNGFSQYLKLEQEFANDKSKIRYHIYPSQLKSGMTNFHPDRFDPNKQTDLFEKFKGLRLTVWQDKRIVHWAQALPADLNFKKPLEIDLLIISNNSLNEPKKLTNLFNPKKIIIDASNSYYNIQNIKAKFDNLNLDYYIVPEKGAFEWNL